ncbi:hypothetical protein KCTC52924_00365 [Arenibacter antarcticus]
MSRVFFNKEVAALGAVVKPPTKYKSSLETDGLARRETPKKIEDFLRSHRNSRYLTVKVLAMKTTPEHNERIASMTFSSVFPHYVTKVEKKGRTKEELYEVIQWLTGYDAQAVQELIAEKVTFETFFQNAKLNPNAHLITGVICGYRIAEIDNTLTQQVRYLDKLVDELAKGRKMNKILREA